MEPSRTSGVAAALGHVEGLVGPLDQGNHLQGVDRIGGDADAYGDVAQVASFEKIGCHSTAARIRSAETSASFRLA